MSPPFVTVFANMYSRGNFPAMR